jgi:acetoin utilization protein AcuB
MKDILLKDVMVTNPYVLNIDDPFSMVEEYFHMYNIRHLPVVDKDGILKGIITQRDLYRIRSPMKTMEGEAFYDRLDLNRFILKHVMTKGPLTLHPDDTLTEAINAMVKQKYGCIPIVNDENKLLGIVTQIDALRVVAKEYLKL